MRRRAFLAGAGASVIAGTGGVTAQEPAKSRRIALVVIGRPISDLTETSHAYYSALIGELRRLGYVEGRNTTLQRWSTEGRVESEFDDLARHVAGDKPDLILAGGTRLALALKRATTEIPIVFFATMPVETGLVASLARPGGNATGFAVDAGPDMGGKRLQLLHDAVPAVTRVAMFYPAQSWPGISASAARNAAEQLGLTVAPMLIDGQVTEASIRRAFAAQVDRTHLALFVGTLPEFVPHARAIAELAAAANLPAIGLEREYAEFGLLMSYGPDIPELHRFAAGYIDRILKGAKPADLPVQQPTKFEFVVNLKTARTLGIELPLNVMGFVSEYIE